MNFTLKNILKLNLFLNIPKRYEASASKLKPKSAGEKSAGEKSTTKKEEKKSDTPAAKSVKQTKKKAPLIKTFKIYRYRPELKQPPKMETFKVNVNDCGIMVLDALFKIKMEQDSSLAFRRSCREGVCGSCAVNINGLNKLLCETHIKKYPSTITIYPLPHMYVIRDLIVDMDKFQQQHNRIRPYLIRQKGEVKGVFQYLQSMPDRDSLDGLVECILCGCCSASCPSYWWHGLTKEGDDFLGPAALLNSYRWLIDTRDLGTEKRLNEMTNFYNVYRCHNINNCTTVCPKGLNPAKAIAHVRLMLSGFQHRKAPELVGQAEDRSSKMCYPEKHDTKPKCD